MQQNEWTDWAGGDAPLLDDTKVEVRYRNGSTERLPVHRFRWFHAKDNDTACLPDHDIVAYRSLEPISADDDRRVATNPALFAPYGAAGKETNPKDAVGIRKLSFSVLPWRVLTGVALAMLEGAAKYGRHNYRASGVRASVYFDAVVARHLTDWWEGVDIDPDSGEHHVDKAISALMVMRDSMYHGNFVDDRPPSGRVDMVDLNRRAGTILDRHADKAPRHYTIADTEPQA